MSTTNELRDVFESVTDQQTVTDEQNPEAARPREADPEEFTEFDVESVRNDSMADASDDMEVNVR